MNFNVVNQFLDSIFEWTWRTSLQASVLILLVCLIQLAAGKWLVPRSRYFLGVLVLVRLLLPAVPPSAFSIFNLSKDLLPAAPQTVFSVAPSSSRPTTLALAKSLVSPAPVGMGAGVDRQVDWLKAVQLLWLLGLMVNLLTVLRQQRKLARWIAAARPMGDERILSLLESCKRVMGVRRQIRVVLAPQPGTPGLFGFIKPRVLLPESAKRKLRDRELQMVFLHELAHVRRGDILLNWIVIVARSLHWFNPLVWLALRRLRADRELVCDAMVMSRLAADERRAYGDVLIKLLDNFSDAGFRPSLAPVINRKHEIKRRVAMIAQFKPVSRVALLPSAVIIVAVCCFTFTRAAERSPKSSAKEKSARQTEAQPDDRPSKSSASAALDSLKKQLEEQNAQVREAQKRFDNLRSELGISDFLAEGESLAEARRSSGLNPEAIHRLESEKIGAETEYRRLDSLSSLLASKGEGELQRVINVAVPDELLTSLLKAKAECEQRLANLGSKFGPENPEAKGTQEELRKIHEQVKGRVEGIMAGLRVKAEAVQAEIKSLRVALNEARMRDAEVAAKYRPYLEAKRLLENLQKVRDAIQLRILQEQIDAALSSSSRR